ncbi:histidine phosphatase family protein [Rhodovulum sp. DZ06]|uniref:histidine phosphatase family protein n=1 Tax=Rhodovulum sp. DZ06 TaxID=3425126 RepID=UPI003D33B702
MFRQTAFALARVAALLLLLAGLSLLAPGRGAAEPARDALSGPGPLVVMLRHALAPGTGDPAGFTLGDCSTQRNLDDRGRAQAARIGAALREAGFAPDAVLTSGWCRCRETAELIGLGAPERFQPLDSFFGNRAEGPAQTAALKARLAAMGDGEKLLLVTHQVNITALTGIFPSSGEAVVFRPAADGAPEVIGTVETGW